MKSVKHISFCLLIIIGFTTPAFAQISRKAHLEAEMRKTINGFNGSVGVGIMGLDFKDSLLINDSKHYPMQSVYKFPLAIAILHKVDKGTLSLKQIIHIPKTSLDTATWSPMVKDFPNQDIEITLADLLTYTISKSDNNGCDILFRIAGGTKTVNNYIHGIGVSSIAIVATEREMKKAWPVQYTNWCQPAAMLRLLQLFYNGKLLSKESNDFLVRIMTKSENSPNRIKGLLPPEAVLAHKTGTSNTNSQSVTAATNDVGILTLPNDRHIAIVVYVSDYKGGVAKGEQLIAQLSKLVWDYYSL